MDTNALKRDETSGTSLKVIGNRLGRVLLPVFLAISLTACDVTPSFPPAGIRAGRLFCASARLKQWAA